MPDDTLSPTPLRRRDRAMDWAEAAARRLLAPLRPRVSLTSGSAMVLLTLLLPIGHESCSPDKKGYELLRGDGGEFPTILALLSPDAIDRIYYGLFLLLAAGTLLLVASSLGRMAALSSRPLLGPVSNFSAILSLFLISDATFFGFGMIFQAPLQIISRLTSLNLDVEDSMEPLAGILLVTICLLPPGLYWPAGSFWKWFGGMTLTAAILVTLSAFSSEKAGRVLGGVVWLAFILGPQTVLWARWRGRFRGEAEWRQMRRGLAAFYFFAVIADLAFLPMAWGEGVWGFIPLWFGVHLISVGYWRMAKEVGASPAPPNAVPL